jgi:hypothetical protein
MVIKSSQPADRVLCKVSLKKALSHFSKNRDNLEFVLRDGEVWLKDSKSECAYLVEPVKHCTPPDISRAILNIVESGKDEDVLLPVEAMAKLTKAIGQAAKHCTVTLETFKRGYRLTTKGIECYLVRPRKD